MQKHRRQSKVEAALAAKAKEAHVKVVKETGERLSEAKQNSVLEFAALKELDVPVREALANGSIRLLDAEWLRSTSSANAPKRMQRRQDLEEGERTASEYHHDDGDVPLSPFLSAQEAVRLLGAGDRSVGVLSYGWTTRGDPDPLGSYLRACASSYAGRRVNTSRACFGTLRVCTSGHGRKRRTITFRRRSA